jgi:hypothetical protein
MPSTEYIKGFWAIEWAGVFALLIAKLVFGVHCSWWLVFAPLWVPIVLGVFLRALGALLSGLAWLLNPKERAHRRLEKALDDFKRSIGG